MNFSISVARSDIEKGSSRTFVNEDNSLFDGDRNFLEVRILAGSGCAESVLKAEMCAMGTAHQQPFLDIEEFRRRSIVKAHGQVSAFILVGPGGTIRHLQQDSLLFQGSVHIIEFEAVPRDVVQGRYSFHCGN